MSSKAQYVEVRLMGYWLQGQREPNQWLKK